MKTTRKHTSLFLLLVAIMFSINIHGFSHIEENDHGDENAGCELCIINKTEEKVFVAIMPSTTTFSIEEVIIALNKKALISSPKHYPSKKWFKSDYFNKPPPTSIL